MSKYGPDNCRVFDAGYDPDITATRVAGFDINVENTFLTPCPGYRRPFFGRGLVGFIG